MHARFVALAAAFGAVSATIAPNSPVSSTVCTGSQVCTISWIEDNTKPLISEFGPTSVGLFVGSVYSQTLVQDFGVVENPASNATLSVSINPTAGPDGDFYFVRFQSVSATDDSGNALQSFSSKFTLAGMSGSLTDIESDQIAGKSVSSSATATAAASAMVSGSGMPSGSAITSASGASVPATKKTSAVKSSAAATSDSDSTSAAASASSSQGSGAGAVSVSGALALVVAVVSAAFI